MQHLKTLSRTHTYIRMYIHLQTTLDSKDEGGRDDGVGRVGGK